MVRALEPCKPVTSNEQAMTDNRAAVLATCKRPSLSCRSGGKGLTLDTLVSFSLVPVRSMDCRRYCASVLLTIAMLASACVGRPNRLYNKRVPENAP